MRFIRGQLNFEDSKGNRTLYQNGEVIYDRDNPTERVLYFEIDEVINTLDGPPDADKEDDAAAPVTDADEGDPPEAAPPLTTSAAVATGLGGLAAAAVGAAAAAAAGGGAAGAAGTAGSAGAAGTAAGGPGATGSAVKPGKPEDVEIEDKPEGVDEPEEPGEPEETEKSDEQEETVEPEKPDDAEEPEETDEAETAAKLEDEEIEDKPEEPEEPKEPEEPEEPEEEPDPSEEVPDEIPEEMVSSAFNGGPGENLNTEYTGGEGPARCIKTGLPNYWVNTANLGLVIRDEIFSIQGLGPRINLTLTCNSHDRKRKGWFGQGWSFSWESYLTCQKGKVWLRRGSGQELTFNLPDRDEPGEYPLELTPSPGNYHRLYLA